MKQGIHPQYVECTVTCSCGNTFKTHATVSEMKVELCNECHPFYTGQQKFVDTGGGVQRFADKFLVGKGTVAFRRVKKGNAVVNGLMQQFNQFFFFGVFAAVIIQSHTAESDFGNF